MPTSETARIRDQLQRVFDGDPWWGPATLPLLRGLTAEQAAHRPIPRAHTIWEIVLHMAAWKGEVARRLHTGEAREPAEGDWPPVPEPATEEGWRAAVERLERAHREVLDALEGMTDERLREPVGETRDRPLGSGVSFYVHLHGLVQHDVAHTAQISLLRKAFAPE